MIEFFAKFLVKNFFKVTLVAILIPILLQFKPIIYSTLMNLNDSVPSFNKTYDSILSIRSPFATNVGKTPNEELIDELIPQDLKQKYPPEIIQNLESSIDELITLQKHSRNHLSKTFINDAFQQIKVGNFTPAKNIMLTRYQNSTSDKEKSEFLLHVGNFEIFEDPEFALSYYEKAFRLNNKNFNALNDIGHIYRLTGDNNNAISFYAKLAHEAQIYGEWQYVASAESNIGVVYQQMGDYSLAKKYYFAALDINNKLSNELRAATQYFNLGTVYEVINEQEKACDYFRKARIIFYRNFKEELVYNLDKELKRMGCH